MRPCTDDVTWLYMIDVRLSCKVRVEFLCSYRNDSFGHALHWRRRDTDAGREGRRACAVLVQMTYRRGKMATMTVVMDRERLVAALRQHGVDWLAPSDAHGTPVPDEMLIASLATHDDPRLRQALSGLFLLQPALAVCVPHIVAILDEPATSELKAYYTAAVYLQTMWRFRLARYLPAIRELPDYFSPALSLPSREDAYGKAGLYALAAWHARCARFPYNYVSVYAGLADLLFASLKTKRVPHASASTR